MGCHPRVFFLILRLLLLLLLAKAERRGEKRRYGRCTLPKQFLLGDALKKIIGPFTVQPQVRRDDLKELE